MASNEFNFYVNGCFVTNLKGVCMNFKCNLVFSGNQGNQSAAKVGSMSVAVNAIAMILEPDFLCDMLQCNRMFLNRYDACD